MFNNAIELKFYDIAYEICHFFLADLLKKNYYDVFDQLFDYFRESDQYDVKLALLLKTLPLIKKEQVFRLMKDFDDVLKYPSTESIFKKSVNPIQTGLFMFKVIDDIQTQFNFSYYTSLSLKTKLEDNMVEILKMYKNSAQIKVIVANIDINGLDAFYYIQKYDIFKLLETKIMNQYIMEKWFGDIDLNSSMLDLSTSYSIYVNKNDLFMTGEISIFERLFNITTTFRKS